MAGETVNRQEWLESWLINKGSQGETWQCWKRREKRRGQNGKNENEKKHSL
jgi:hypothetical protein